MKLISEHIQIWGKELWLTKGMGNQEEKHADIALKLHEDQSMYQVSPQGLQVQHKKNNC